VVGRGVPAAAGWTDPVLRHAPRLSSCAAPRTAWN